MWKFLPMPLNCLQFFNVPPCLVLFETTSLIGCLPSEIYMFMWRMHGTLQFDDIWNWFCLILWFRLNIINLKVYLLWCENCTLLNSRNKILTVKYILSFYMKVYQINRDDLVPTFYINATFNGGSCLSFLQSIIFQFYLYHVQSLDHL